MNSDVLRTIIAHDTELFETHSKCFWITVAPNYTRTLGIVDDVTVKPVKLGVVDAVFADRAVSKHLDSLGAVHDHILTNSDSSNRKCPPINFHTHRIAFMNTHFTAEELQAALQKASGCSRADAVHVMELTDEEELDVRRKYMLRHNLFRNTKEHGSFRGVKSYGMSDNHPARKTLDESHSSSICKQDILSADFDSESRGAASVSDLQPSGEDKVYIYNNNNNTVGVGGEKKYTKYLDDVDNKTWPEILQPVLDRYASIIKNEYRAYIKALEPSYGICRHVAPGEMTDADIERFYECDPEWWQIKLPLLETQEAELLALWQAWLESNSPIISTTSAVRCTRIAITYIGIYAALLTINRPRQYARWLWPSPRGPGPPISRDVIVKVDSNFNDLQFSSDILMTKCPEY